MSDDHVTNQPAPHMPRRDTGFRPPRRTPRRWTGRETWQVAVAALALGVVAIVMANVYGWSPRNAALVCLIGAVAGAVLSAIGVINSRPRGTRVDGRDLPGPDSAAPKVRAPGQVPLPQVGITIRPTPASLRSGPDTHRTRKLGGHRKAIAGIAVAPDGETAVTCGEEGAVIAWDMASGFALWALSGFKQEGRAVVISPDGQLLAAAGVEEARGDALPLALVHVADANTGRALRRIEFQGQPRSLAWLPDSRHLLIACNERVRVWEVDEPAEVTDFPISATTMALNDVILALSTDPAGKVLLAGTQISQDVRVLSLPGGEEVLSLDGHRVRFSFFRLRSVRAVATSSDARLALSGSNDGTARVWSIRSGEELCRFNGHAGWWGWHGVTGVAWLPGDEAALSSGEDGTLRMWDTRDGRELRCWDHGRGIRRLAVGADGKVALTGAWDGSIRVWHLG